MTNDQIKECSISLIIRVDQTKTTEMPFNLHLIEKYDSFKCCEDVKSHKTTDRGLNLSNHLEHLFSKYGPHTRRISNTWEIVRKANFQTSSQTS